MKASGIIHQQICQLKWHILACLGLIMVLPIEEAIVNLRAGDGFNSLGWVIVAVMFSPLLAGLIACANVQGDLSEKRYIFWRSKPANVKKLMTLKFLVGLIVSLAIIACPIIFAIVSRALCGQDLGDPPLMFYMPVPIIIAVMTYSLCFGCNVLVRKTARSWLIGILLVGFFLVLPFMLPLDYKDVVSDFALSGWGFYPAILVIVSAFAFVFALYAAQNDWHLRTNLKGLLWVGAGLAFVLLILFSSQVANIKVLQEKKIESSWGPRSLDYSGSRIIYQGHSYIDTDKNSISLSKIKSSSVSTESNHEFTPRPEPKDYRGMTYREHAHGGLYKNVGDNLYYFDIIVHYRREGIPSRKRIYEQVYLRSYNHTVKPGMPVCDLDISDCLTDKINLHLRFAMRFIDNRLIAVLNDSFVVLDVTDPGELKIIDKKLDILKKYRPYTAKERKEEFAIPLLPVEEIGLQERIKLSIDLNYRLYDYQFYESSIVDVHDSKFAFFLVDNDSVNRFDVKRWDDEKVYCRFRSARPFTMLEVMTASPYYHDDNFVKNGKLYSLQNDTLMVFDIRSNRRIRKLGHFVRMDYHIQDIAVLEDGNILLSVRWDPKSVRNRSKEQKYYLYLIKNPE